MSKILALMLIFSLTVFVMLAAEWLGRKMNMILYRRWRRKHGRA